MRQEESKITVLGSGYSAMTLPNEMIDLIHESYEDNDGSSFSVAVETAQLNNFISSISRVTGYMFNTVSINHDSRHTTIQQSNQQYVEPTPTDQQAADMAQVENANVQHHNGTRISFRDVTRNGNGDHNFRSPIFRGVNENQRLEEDAIRRRIHIMSSTRSDLDVNEVERLVNEAASLSDKLIKNQRKLNRLQTDIDNNPMVAELYDQARRLRSTANNKIEDVFFTENHLVIRTENLLAYCESDNRHHEIGRMEFLISLEALICEEFQTRFITIRNLTREMLVGDSECGRQAPHVNNAGNACFGNVTSTLIELMTRRDLITMVDQLVRYIETPNESDSMGRYAKYWPVVDDNANANVHVAPPRDHNTEPAGGGDNAD